MVMLKLPEAALGGEPESLTLIVKLKFPAVVGIPEIVPVVDRVRPTGKVPELMLQLYGMVPPVAANVVEYAVPTCPDGTDVVVICSDAAPAITVRLSGFVAFWTGEEESAT